MLIPDLPFEEYLALDRASSHRLWSLLDKSPKHMRAEIEKPREPSVSMNLGTVVHALVGGERVAVLPDTENSTAGREKLVAALSDIAGVPIPEPPLTARTATQALSWQVSELRATVRQKAIVTCPKKTWDIARRMADELLRKPVARVLFADGQAEQSCLQIDPETGLELKCRFDWLPSGHDIVTETKTAKSVRPRDFQRDSQRFGYPLQAAFYSWLFELETGRKPAFFFAVVENVAPHDTAIYEADKSMIEQGSQMMRRALDIYAECREMDFWPGYDWDWSSSEHAILKLRGDRNERHR